MGHINYDNKLRGGLTTAPEWLKVGASIGELTNFFAGRYDVAAYVGAKTSSNAPACFAPAVAEVEVNPELAFGKGILPDQVGDLMQRPVQFTWPRATGLIFHEAMHARFSTWDIPKAAEVLTQKEMRALVLLEEGRIERKGLDLFPDNACFLRSCVLELVLGDLADEPIEATPTRAAAEILALTSARVDAGSITADDVAGIEDVIMKKIGIDLFDKLREIWVKVQDTPATDTETLYELAREWSKVVEDAAAEAGEGDEPEEGGSAGGPGDDIMEGVMKALREAAEDTSIAANDDVADQQTREEWREEVQARSSKASRRSENTKTATEVFGKGTGPVADTRTSSRLIATRKPYNDERAAAVKLSALLDKAKYRDRDATEISSIVPPGRLRTRAMVQGAALKSKGVLTQVEPWRRTVRKHTDDPTLSVGVLVDISGSMADAMEPMAVTAWILSEAVRRVQGKAAMIYYGQGVFPVLKPGQHLDEVNVYSASDGTERFDKAFKALDGSLNLLDGTGARMLVVVSDGCYVRDEENKAKQWVRACEAAGVAVTWIDFDHSGLHAKQIIKGTQARYVNARETGTGAADLAANIGKAAAAALTGVSKARAL